MKYVYVASGSPADPKRSNVCRASAALAGFSLISLIGGLKQKDFGFETILAVAMDIKDFHDRFVRPISGTLYVDSSGYSIIKGDVTPENVIR